jgi:hypothetical protein
LGIAIKYCGTCGERISPQDDSKTVTIGNISYCPSCAKELKNLALDEFGKDAATDRKGATAPRKRPSVRRQATVRVKQSSSFPFLAAAAGVGVVLLILIMVAIFASGGGDAREIWSKAVSFERSHKDDPEACLNFFWDRMEKLEGSEFEGDAKERIGKYARLSAKAFEKKHPDEFTEILKTYRDALEKAEGTSYVSKIRADIGQVKKKWKRFKKAKALLRGLEEIRRWMNDNPGDWEEAEEKLRAFAASASGFPDIARKVEADLAKICSARDARLVPLFDGLVERARALAAKERFAEAQAVLDEFPRASRTDAWKEKLRAEARAIREMQDRAETHTAKREKMGWKRLFDGTSLQGWRQVGSGRWKVFAGAIVGQNMVKEPAILISTLFEEDDFEFELEMRHGSDPCSVLVSHYPTKKWTLQTPTSSWPSLRDGKWHKVSISVRGNCQETRIDGRLVSRIDPVLSKWSLKSRKGHPRKGMLGIILNQGGRTEVRNLWARKAR